MGALSGGQIPLALTVLQVLALDIGTGMLPALALGGEVREAEKLQGQGLSIPAVCRRLSISGQALDISMLKDLRRGTGEPDSARGGGEDLAASHRVSQRRACRLVKAMIHLAETHPRYGYRRVHALPVADGWAVIVKRIERRAARDA